MTLLWLALAVLLLLATWLLTAPLRGARRLHAAQQDYEARDRTAEQNVAIFRRRLDSLEAAYRRGEVDEARYQEDRLELERSLLEDTEALARPPLKAPTSGRWLVPVVVLALVAGSLTWYHRQGAGGDLALYAAQQEVLADPEASMARMTERFEQEASRQPDNPKVWSTLFPLYRDQGRLEEAVDALERLIALEGRHPALLAQLAQMRFFVAGRTLTDDVQALIDEALAQDPRQPTVLGMLGIEAFDHGRYEEAIDHWRRAIAGFDDPEAAASLRQGIAVAEQRLARAGTGDAATADRPAIRVRLSLDASLEGRVAPDTRVFLVARDLDGELPPLAIAMTEVSALPTTLVLDDARAMSAAATLSAVEEVRLVARASKSGQARPQAGDLVGQRSPVAVAEDETVEVVIDRVVE